MSVDAGSLEELRETGRLLTKVGSLPVVVFWDSDRAYAIEDRCPHMQVLDQEINPAIAAHGGYAELVAVEGSIAYLRLSGGCQGCGLAAVTLSQGIEVAILDNVSEITEVIDVTDHASGANPYYEAAKK